ncbi:MAG: rhomboid family intramembrane serine protease [Acidobacteriota bacterium]
MKNEEQDAAPSSPFRVCPACGQLTPRNEAQCADCGALSPQGVEEQEERRFFQSLFSRATPVTYGLVAINVIYYFIVSWFGLESATLIAFGAKTNALLREGDWFRLVTPIFIHGGLLHLFFNSYVLWANGPLVEWLYGSARFLLIYLLSGIGGVIGSYVWQEAVKNADVPSVGASGALFGLFGLLAVFGYRFKEVPTNFQRALRSSVLPAIVINLIIGFSVDFIDNGGHIGGLVVGALLAFVIPYLPLGTNRKTAAGWAILAACGLVVVLSFAGALRQTSWHLGWRAAVVNSYLTGVGTAVDSMQEVDSTDTQNAKAPTITNAITALQSAVAPDQRSAAIRTEMLEQLRKQQELARSGTKTQELQINLKAFKATHGEYKDWYKTDLQKQAVQHGLKFEPKGSQ